MSEAVGTGHMNGAFGTGHMSGLDAYGGAEHMSGPDADGSAEHMTSRDAVDPDLCHLLARAAAVERRIRHAVELRRSSDPDPDDDFRGLYLTDENIVRLLDEAGARGSRRWRSLWPGASRALLRPRRRRVPDWTASRGSSASPRSTRRSCSSRSYRIWMTASRRSTAT